VLGNDLPLVDHADQADIFVNIARLPEEFAVACIVNDRRYGKGVRTPLKLRIDESRSLASTRQSCDIACGVEDFGDVVTMLLTTSLTHGCSDHDAFVRHMVIALCAIHGDDHREFETVPGGLRPWQKRVAEQMLGGATLSKIAIPEVAHACGLSTPHFGRAFTKSFQMSPYRWLLNQRLQKAKTLLMDSNESLADVACECGFCDQSHLSHAFSRRFGLSPGAWRKNFRCGSSKDTESVERALHT
jgi:AraC-like DNA-binding protein